MQCDAFRFAVCCRGSSNALNGCINDAHCMMFLLKSRFQFQDSDFRVLTDDQASPSQWPTRANMFEGFRWLAADARPGDSLVFHYSGSITTTAFCLIRKEKSRTVYVGIMMGASKPRGSLQLLEQGKPLRQSGNKAIWQQPHSFWSTYNPS